MKEIWKNIKNYEGLYQISNFGNVKSLVGWDIRTHQYIKREKILVPMPGEYFRVILYKDRKPKTFYIHRLVAETFLINDKSNMQVNHKDENKLNNNVYNLEWISLKENVNYGTRNDRESKVKTKYHVLQFSLDGKFIKKWMNVREIVLNTNYKKHNIANCCRGKSDNAYGYKWKYVLRA